MYDRNQSAAIRGLSTTSRIGTNSGDDVGILEEMVRGLREGVTEEKGLSRPPGAGEHEGGKGPCCALEAGAELAWDVGHRSSFGRRVL